MGRHLCAADCKAQMDCADTRQSSAEQSQESSKCTAGGGSTPDNISPQEQPSPPDTISAAEAPKSKNCTTCNRKHPLTEFTGGRATCNGCRSRKRKYYATTSDRTQLAGHHAEIVTLNTELVKNCNNQAEQIAWLKGQLTEANRQTGYLTEEFKKAREDCHGICEHNRMLMQYISEANTALSAPPSQPHHLTAPQHETPGHALIHREQKYDPNSMPPVRCRTAWISVRPYTPTATTSFRVHTI